MVGGTRRAHEIRGLLPRSCVARQGVKNAYIHSLEQHGSGEWPLGKPIFQYKQVVVHFHVSSRECNLSGPRQWTLFRCPSEKMSFCHKGVETNQARPKGLCLVPK